MAGLTERRKEGHGLVPHRCTPSSRMLPSVIGGPGGLLFLRCQRASSVLSIGLPLDSTALFKKSIPEVRDGFREHLTLLRFRSQED